MSQKKITIIGGGLAGLALGIGLRKRGIEVRILEAGKYPRHRVCGEFICGVEQATLETLGISGAFENAVTNYDSRWFFRGRPVLKKNLPVPAIGISRHALDDWLAKEFQRLDGELITNARAKEDEFADEATVWTSGRRRRRDGPWLGLKCHALEFGKTMQSDLEMHFGSRCYVGISRVENGIANVCGLFRKRSEIKAGERGDLILEYLHANKLGKLAQQLESGGLLPESLLGVSAFRLGHQDPPAGDRLQLGDAFSMIPPFTGNGMTMAFQSAELALPGLVEYAEGKRDWSVTATAIRSSLHQQFDRRVRWAMRLHPFLLNPIGQRAFVAAAKLKAVPFSLFFKKTRA